MYRALISDIDGTIIASASDGIDITNGLIAAIAEAKAAGKFIGLASGRGYKATKNIIDKLGIDQPCVLEGGSVIVEPHSGNPIWEKYLDASVVVNLLELFQGMAPYEKDTYVSIDHVHYPLASLPMTPKKERYVYLIGITEAQAIPLQNAINELGIASAHIVHKSWKNPELVDLHCVHPEGTKEHGITEWIKLLGLKKEEVIGMGDGGNDIPLFESVGLRVAVEDGNEELKEAADIIAPAQKDGAAEHIIRKYLLGN